MRQPLRRIRIDGAAVTTLSEAWGALERALDLPAHFGRNLDALHDSLTTDVPGPLDIDWRASGRTAAALGVDFDRLRTTMEEASMARPDLRVRFRSLPVPMRPVQTRPVPARPTPARKS